MATLRNKRKLAAVPRQTPENTRNNQSQNTVNPEMAEEYITRVSGEVELRVTKKLSQVFSQKESRILVALSNFDEFFVNPQVRTCFRSCSGNIQEQQLRKPGTQWGSFSKRPLSRIGVLSLSHQKVN